MIDYRLAQLQKHQVPVRFGLEATPENVRAYEPDLIVVATGSQPAIPAIPGLDSRVYTADQALALLRDGDFPHAKRCAVLGGGLVGLEVADALCEQAIQPEIFELTDAVGAGLNANRLYFIKQRLERAGVLCTAVRAWRESPSRMCAISAKGRRTSPGRLMQSSPRWGVKATVRWWTV